MRSTVNWGRRLVRSIGFASRSRWRKRSRAVPRDKTRPARQGSGWCVAGLGRSRGSMTEGAAGAGTGRRAAQAGVRDRPLHGRADEDRGVVDAIAASTGTVAAAAIDLIAVILVVGHPVDVVEGLVVVAQ